MWHEQTRQWRENDELVVIGITQEQHPERCQLFAQWHEIEWPILHDPIGLIGATAVPYFIAIDEHGIVRETRPRPQSFEEGFLAKSFEPTDSKPTWMNRGPEKLTQLAEHAEATDSALAWRDYGDALLLWKQPRPINDIIAAYTKSKQADDEQGRIDFRIGVAKRMRFESSLAREDDFQAAVDAWQEALDKDPNQYIWRRRIQQYGPRLDKPYPFYDWIAKAREEISARGQIPIALDVEPRGAELAMPARDLSSTSNNELQIPARLRDDQGKISRDVQGFINQRSVVVRGTGNTSKAFQVHLEFAPDANVHWNNETDPMVVWLTTSDDLAVDHEVVMIDAPAAPESTEKRSAEFEVRFAEPLQEPVKLSGYALVNLCEESGGQCLFVRKDFVVELTPAGPSDD